jgi:hypothetical protein
VGARAASCSRSGVHIRSSFAFARNLAPLTQCTAHLQSSKEAQIHEQAKLELFERQNVAGASDRTTDALAAQANESAAQLKAPSQMEASTFSIKVNENRAKDTKVSNCYL